jgi:hypothetical protein
MLALTSPISGGSSVGIVRACGLKPRSLFLFCFYSPFMESEGLLPSSQELQEPTSSKPISLRSVLIISSYLHLRLPSGIFCFGKHTQSTDFNYNIFISDLTGPGFKALLTACLNSTVQSILLCVTASEASTASVLRKVGLFLLFFLFLLRAYVKSLVTLVHRTGKEIVGSYRTNCTLLFSFAMGLKARKKRGVVKFTSLSSLSHFRHSASSYFTDF